MAFRIGLLPGQWEELQPCELLAMAEADQWRRERDLEALAYAIVLLREPHAKTDRKDVLIRMPGRRRFRHLPPPSLCVDMDE